jgi:formamidopyrimidine-DNA glycosylase
MRPDGAAGSPAMPELPEVEVAARNLTRWARGRRVKAVEAIEPRTLGGDKPVALRGLVGKRLATVERLGKNLLLTFATGTRTATTANAKHPIGVWSHLGMTGKWLRRAANDPVPRFSRLRLEFPGGLILYFVDMRLFGFFRLVDGADFRRLPEIAALGPDPLREGIDVARLTARLALRRKVPVKVAIMDQALIPGVGNIQASEGLFRAAIDPRRPASSLTAAEARRLARSLLASFRHTLRAFAADKADGGGKDITYVEETGTRNPFKVYDRPGARCPRCGKGTITRLVQAGRSTYFCAACQH